MFGPMKPVELPYLAYIYEHDFFLLKTSCTFLCFYETLSLYNLHCCHERDYYSSEKWRVVWLGHKDILSKCHTLPCRRFGTLVAILWNHTQYALLSCWLSSPLRISHFSEIMYQCGCETRKCRQTVSCCYYLASTRCMVLLWKVSCTIISVNMT